MIKLENTILPSAEQWEAIIRGARNPMNSWDRSDSEIKNAVLKDEEVCPGVTAMVSEPCVPYISIGPNDHSLMMKLAKGGPVHAKYRRMIEVYVDITAPFYWWKEFDTYKVGTVANSCSTMHKIHAKEFTLEDFSCEHLTDGSINLLKDIICELNRYRSFYNRYDELDDKNFTNGPITCKKDLWYQMIQLLPSSYNQKRTVMMSYEVLVGMYRDRKNHKLDEWHVLCDWIEGLPYSELITGKEGE